ncbi:YcaO-like family protein [Archangium lansingense]|uniref:YcaO-like family protein n=1 Tax=Archangium lansingense TaxID=2995310 RepID=UPI003B7A0075
MLLEVSKGVSVLQTRKALLEVRGLPFPLLVSILRKLRRGGEAAFARELMRLGVDRSDALGLGARLAAEGAFGPGAPRLLDERALREASGIAGRLRLGPLRTVDITAGNGALVQLSARGWRSAGRGVCMACGVLWEVQGSDAPAEAAILANALPRRAVIALGSTELAALRSALGGPPTEEKTWTEGAYRQRRGRRVRPRAAAGCGCTPPAGAVDLTVTTDIARMASAALERMGITTRESTVRGRRGTPPIFSVTWGAAVLRPRKRGRPIVSGQLLAQVGTGASLEERKLTARAEVIERASAILRVPDIRATPARALGRPFLPLRDWDLYTPEQYASPGFPYAPVTEDTPLDWLWATDAGSGERLLVPAAFTTSERLAGPRFVCGSSNGVATHTRDDAALRSALLEVAERDALQLAWYRGQGAQRIDRRTVPLEEGTQRFFRDAGWDLHFSYLAGRASLHVIALIAEATGEGPFPKGGTLLTAAAAGAPEEAVRRALREMRMVTEALSLPRELEIDFEALQRPPKLAGYQDIESLIDITMLYLNPAMRSAVELFLGGPPVALPRRVVPDSAGALIPRLRRDGLRTLIIDLTLATAAPFRTYQALVLGTQPLAFTPSLLRLGSGLLPRRLPPRNPGPPPSPLKVRRGHLNPYVLPLA